MRTQAVEYNRFDKGIDIRKSAAVSDANRLRELNNAYITDGWAIKKRPGLVKVADLALGTKELIQIRGELYTLSSNVDAANSTETIKNLKVALSEDPTQPIHEVHYFDVFNGQPYLVIEYENGEIRHSFNSVQITDANNPRSTSCVKMASRIYAIDGDVVRMSAVNDPTDWTDNAAGAGFLPTGLQAPADETALAVSEYDGTLAVFMVDSIQLWAVDEDPAQHALVKIIRNIGTRFGKTVGQYSNDLLFMSDYGFRSISRQQLGENREDNDIGSAIDPLVRPLIGPLIKAEYSDAGYEVIRGNGPHSNTNLNDFFLGDVTDPDFLSANRPKAVYYPNAGQYWCIIGRKVFVFTYSRSASINAWSTYEFSDGFDTVVSLKGELYFRRGNELFTLDESYATDNGLLYKMSATTSYQSQKAVGVAKLYKGFDMSQEGNCEITFLTNAADDTEGTAPIGVEGNSRPFALIPITMISNGVAVKIENNDDQPYQLDSLILYFNKLGIQV
jgi:hypothetical protein